MRASGKLAQHVKKFRIDYFDENKFEDISAGGDSNNDLRQTLFDRSSDVATLEGSGGWKMYTHDSLAILPGVQTVNIDNVSDDDLPLPGVTGDAVKTVFETGFNDWTEGNK